MAFGKHLINVLFHRPGRAHPPAGHLINDHVGPEKFLHFLSDVVTAVDVGVLEVETCAVEKGQRGVVQGGVVAAVGVGELFTAVEQQNLLHGMSLGK